MTPWRYSQLEMLEGEALIRMCIRGVKSSPRAGHESNDDLLVVGKRFS